jgi:hypothetical protein
MGEVANQGHSVKPEWLGRVILGGHLQKGHIPWPTKFWW